MAAWGYESYLLVLKVSLTRDTKNNFTLRRFYSLREERHVYFPSSFTLSNLFSL